jgi:hypothetical protein
MIYFKSLLVGLCAVLLGCVLAPIAMLVWASWVSQSGDGATVSFSPMGLLHSLSFWIFIILLFLAGFVSSVFFLKR